MAIWTISDLHLSSVRPKPMDIFGDHWRNHAERIATTWRARIAPEDTVLIAGDISWALKIPDALPDLQWIDTLPGRKVITKGNHDYWWHRVGPLRPYLPPSMIALEASAADIGEAVICGTRGWVTPDTPGFNGEEDQRVYEREVQRLERALQEGRKLAVNKPLIVMIHYPPFLNGQPTEFARRIAAAQPAACVYGHLHTPQDWAIATQGVVDGVYYQLTACDYLNFGPVIVRGLTQGNSE